MDSTHRRMLTSLIEQLSILRNMEARILEVGPDARERKMLAENVYDIEQATSLLTRILNR